MLHVRPRRGHRLYPYPFLDAAAIGYPTAVGATSLVVVLALVLAIVLTRLDRRPVR